MLGFTIRQKSGQSPRSAVRKPRGPFLNGEGWEKKQEKKRKERKERGRYRQQDTLERRSRDPMATWESEYSIHCPSPSIPDSG